MTSRPSAAAPILAALAIVLALLGGYVGAYLMLSERWELLARKGGVEGIERRFKQQWLCTLFVPAAWVEAKAVGLPVVLRSASPYQEAEQDVGMPPMPGGPDGPATFPAQ